ISCPFFSRCAGACIDELQHKKPHRELHEMLMRKMLDSLVRVCVDKRSEPSRVLYIRPSQVLFFFLALRVKYKCTFFIHGAYL
uniref:Uncharacterized protein n=1 Tax=Aegilops tauschii subsp. strangulata TaxID=200361 RepID=A0A453ITJ0_AEGTS